MAEEIRRIVGELSLRELKDPGLKGLAGVSGAEVTGDGSYATIYVMVSCGPDRDAADESEKKIVLEALQRAKGHLRREIGARLQCRHTPDLIFKIDESLEYGRRMEQVFETLNLGGASAGKTDAAFSGFD
jgi:ribosome-binding factor A